MMQLPAWLREGLRRADDWRASLRVTLDEVLATPADADRAIACGHVLEHVEPDRRAALRAYTSAWEGARSTAALAAARRVAREIRAHAEIATLAQAEHQRGGDPAALVEAAGAWLDAGESTRALRALVAAHRALPPGPEADRVASLRNAVDGTIRDPRGEVARWFERAVGGDDAAAAVHTLHLARLARLPEDQQARLLRVALDKWPGDDAIAAFVEEHLLGRGDADELLTFYRIRFATRPEARAWAEEVRAAATRLCVRGIAPGLGLRLLRKGLEHAYAAGLGEVPGHLASWALLVEHARKIRATAELMPLAVQALKLGLPDDDRLWLARFGLEVCWRDAKDAEAATAYAAIVIELAPGHPDVREFVGDQDVAVDLEEGAGELAISLVYLDEHVGRVEEDVAVAARATGLAAAALAGAPHTPPSNRPAWMSASTAEMAAVSEASLEQTAAALVEPRVTETISVPPAPSEEPVAPFAPVIPTAALAALRRIATKVEVPKAQPLPEGARARAARIVVPVDTILHLDDGSTIAAVVRDISTTGLFVPVELEIAIGAEVMLELRLPGIGDALATSKHRAWARVARKGQGGYGLELLDPEPALVEAIAALSGSPG